MEMGFRWKPLCLYKCIQRCLNKKITGSKLSCSKNLNFKSEQMTVVIDPEDD